MPSSLREEILFNHDPAAYLPHRTPFLFLDRILSLDPGIAATAVKRVTSETGDFPVVLLVEAMAQLAGVVASREEGAGGFLAAIERAEFLSRVYVGDTLMVAVRIAKSFGRLHLVEGEVTVDGQAVARASLTLGIGLLG